MRKLTLLLTMLLTITTVLSSCSPAPSAYDFEEIGLEPPELAEGEKAVWYKRSPFNSFMMHVAYYGSVKKFALSDDVPYDEEVEEPFYKYKKDIWVFDADRKVNDKENTETINLLYDALFSAEQFLNKHLKDDFKVQNMWVFNCVDQQWPSYRIYPTEFAVYYATDNGNYVLLICARHNYNYGEEITFLVPWDKFVSAMESEQDRAINTSAMGAHFFEEYEKFFSDYVIKL